MPINLKAQLKKTIDYIMVNNVRTIFSLLTLAFAGVLIYRNTFGVPFLFDDITQIVLNHKIQTLEWPWNFLFNNRRPILYLSLALDFHQYGQNPFGFHIFNIRVHILNAMALFLLVYKTCRLPRISRNIQQEAVLFALGTSLLWLCHPIQTQAVTYIIQRAESLMSLFFVLSIYFSAKYLTSRHNFWLLSAAISSLLCGLSKEVAIVLPIVIFLYDRTFFSNSLREALNKNYRLYLSLSLTIGTMLFLYFTTHPEQKLTAGFGMKGITPIEYAMNQPSVILHYLRLAIWPNCLIFDYQWLPVKDISKLFPSIWIITTWLFLLIAAYRRYPIISFLSITFFVILLPSSSFIPLKDLAYEYRIYLPLSCLIILAVLLLKSMIDRIIIPKNRRIFFIVIITTLTFTLGGITYQRNNVYANEETLWRDVLEKQPHNARIWSNLGSYLLSSNRSTEAEKCFLTSLTLDPNSAEVSANLAITLTEQKKFNEALFYAQNAVKIAPDFAVGYNNLGVIYSQMGLYNDAVNYYQKALQLGFTEPRVLKNLGIALANCGRFTDAVRILKNAQRLDPYSENIRSVLEQIQKNRK